MCVINWNKSARKKKKQNDFKQMEKIVIPLNCWTNSLRLEFFSVSCTQWMGIWTKKTLVFHWTDSEEIFYSKDSQITIKNDEECCENISNVRKAFFRAEKKTFVFIQIWIFFLNSVIDSLDRKNIQWCCDTRWSQRRGDTAARRQDELHGICMVSAQRGRQKSSHCHRVLV